MTEDIKAKLREICQKYINILEDIGRAEGEELDKKIKEFLEGVLEIRRVQSLVNGKWETRDYMFLVAYGGPNVWIDGNELFVKASWTEYIETAFTQLAYEGYNKIREFLDEIFSSD